MYICIAPGICIAVHVGKINRDEVIARLRASAERDHEQTSLICATTDVEMSLKDATITRIRDRVQHLGVEAHGAVFVIQNLQTQLSGSRGTAARSEQRGNRAAVSSTNLVQRLTLVTREHEKTLR